MTTYTFSADAFSAFTDDFNEYLADQLMPTVDPRPAYTGRGMNGRECIGFVHPHPHSLMMSLGMFLARVDEKNLAVDWPVDDVLAAFDQTSVHSDAMGRSYITYFADIAVEGADVGGE